MPLTDEQAKQAYDNTLQPEEEQPKYWTVIVSVTTFVEINTFSTKANAQEMAIERVKIMTNDPIAEYGINDIFEQEGE